MKSDFENIFLTFDEKCILFKLGLKKKMSQESVGESLNNLLSLGFVKLNYSGEKNTIGEQIPDGTCSLTDLYLRYRIYKRLQFRKSFVYPMVVAFFTALLTSLIAIATSGR